MEKQRQQLEERSMTLQAQLLRGSERLDRFREEMNLNKARGAPLAHISPLCSTSLRSAQTNVCTTDTPPGGA